MYLLLRSLHRSLPPASPAPPDSHPPDPSQGCCLPEVFPAPPPDLGQEEPSPPLTSLLTGPLSGSPFHPGVGGPPRAQPHPVQGQWWWQAVSESTLVRVLCQVDAILLPGWFPSQLRAQAVGSFTSPSPPTCTHTRPPPRPRHQPRLRLPGWEALFLTLYLQVRPDLEVE